MFTYREHVFYRYFEAINCASALRLQLGISVGPGDEKTKADSIVSARQELERLKSLVTSLENSLPGEVATIGNRSSLKRHLAWCGHYLDRNEPQNCVQDPIDITERDLPEVWEAFDNWCKQHSKIDEEFVAQIEPLVWNGQLDSAARKAWVLFKGRMSEKFDLPPDIDGEKLVIAIFGPDGKTRNLLPGGEREGYLSWFKALYSLNRNPIAHNPQAVDILETEGVLLLINSALARLNHLLGKAD